MCGLSGPGAAYRKVLAQVRDHGRDQHQEEPAGAFPGWTRSSFLRRSIAQAVEQDVQQPEMEEDRASSAARPGRRESGTDRRYARCAGDRDTRS